ncbi:MAG: hypothetical protein IKZ59_01490 [Clostridia bacterium]|nr:hypothetical protein [Clostridia bacterium]
MNFRPGGKTIILWQIRACSAFIASALLFFALSRLFAPLLVPALCLPVLGACASFWYVPVFLKGYNVHVGDNAVTVTCGVIIRTTRVMPYKRLVFAVGYSTPLARLLKLRGIRLRAARADLYIPEMAEDAAELLIFGLSEGEKRD